MTSKLKIKLDEIMNSKRFYSEKTNEMLNYITLEVSNQEIAEEVQSITLKAFDQLRCLVTTVLLFFVSMAIYRFITG
jgi:hypothetical protein